MTSLPPRPFELSLVGAGKAGTAVAAALRAAGNSVVAVASRSEVSAGAAAKLLDAPVTPVAELPPSDVVLLGVPDSSVAPVAAALAPGMRPGAVLWHLSGSLGTAVLPATGPRRCALHPVQVFPSRGEVAPLAGSSWGVTCDEDLRGWAHAVVSEDLRGHPVDVREEDRPVWHAAAVTTANGITALLSLTETLLGSITSADPVRVAGPLAAGALAASLTHGPTASLTGPAVRGEWETVASHVRALETRAPELVAPYLEATRLIFRAAERAGKVSPGNRQAAAAILGGGL